MVPKRPLTDTRAEQNDLTFLNCSIVALFKKRLQEKSETAAAGVTASINDLALVTDLELFSNSDPTDRDRRNARATDIAQYVLASLTLCFL